MTQEEFLGRVRATTLVSAFAAATAVAAPIQFVAYKLHLPFRRFVPMVFHRLVCWIIGIKVHTHGEQVTDRPVLIAANHTSYFDIPILSSLGRLSFIAKDDVARWPFFGLMAKIQDTVFVDRKRRHKTGSNRNLIQTRLKNGETLVLFPEGTSSDGNHVLTFKSALMGAAEPAPGADPAALADILIQPVSIAYTRLHGLPMGREFRPFFAWYGDMDLMPHLWKAFSLGPFDVDVHYHPPVRLSDFKSRKELAAYCHAMVQAGVGHALSGRPGAVGPWFEGRTRPVDGDELAGLPAGIV